MKKIFLGLTLILLMTSCTIAQTEIVITPGNTIEHPFEIEDVSPSEEIGGLISSVNLFYERFIENFLGIKVWKNTLDQGAVENFSLFAFEVGVEPDWPSLVIGEICYTSEEVEINGVTGIWKTKNCSTGGSVADTTGYMNENIITPGGTIKITAWNPSTTSYTINGGGTQTATNLACDSFCPTTEELIEGFGGSVPSFSAKGYVIVPGLNGMKIVYLTDGSTITGLVLDMDLSGDWDFVGLKECKTVDSQQGQALGILPQGTYDIYTIF